MDKVTQTLVLYEWKAFIRNRFQLALLALTCAFGLYAIYYGQSEINAQRETIKGVTTLENEEFSSYKASFVEEMETLEQERTHDLASRPAYAWYRHGYHAILPPHDYAPLAIGQRDLFRYYYRLTGMSLHYQLFENELANPVNLKVGNFDLSFVLIYLFPLLIIAFCFGLYSSDKENGTLALLQIQAVSIRKIIIVRLVFYYFLISGLGVLISTIGLCTSANPFQGNLIVPALAWIGAVVLYCSLWFTIMFFVVSFRKGSSFNAITAAGCWLFFIIVVPAVLNAIVSTKYPLNSSSLAGLTRRTGLENDDDKEEARAVIMEFFTHKPELADSEDLLVNNLMPKAYAAFTTIKDINNQQLVDDYNNQVARRNAWTARFHWLSPSVSLQEVLTHIVQTDLKTFLLFQDGLADFHSKITDFYFTRLFWDKPIVLEDYENLPSFDMPESNDQWQTIYVGMSKIGLMSLMAFAFGYIKMGRR